MVTDSPVAAIDLHIHCPDCDYNLTGVSGDRCPWCGWVIDADALAAATTRYGGIRRWTVVVTAAVVGLACLVVMVALIRRGGPLSWRDGLAVVAVSVGAAGHFALATFAVVGGSRWTIRYRERSGVLRWMGWFSVAAAVFGATQMFHGPRVVRGITVNAAFEFVLAATFFSMPGWMLLGLRLILFDNWRSGGRTRRRDHAWSAPTIAPFFIDVYDGHQRHQITQSWSTSPRPTTPEVEGTIARVWETETVRASADGRRLDDGQLVRLIRATRIPPRLHLELGPTRYREFLGTNALSALGAGAVDPACAADAIGISAIIISRDGFLGFGRRSDRVALHAGHLHAVGGMLDLADRLEGGDFDLFGAIERELVEELGVAAGEIAEVTMMGLGRDAQLLQPEFLFDATLRLSRAEVEAGFAPSHSDGEHVGLEWVSDDPDAVIPFLSLTAPVAPMAEAALLLHGRRAWGAEWFENTCYLRYGQLPPALIPTQRAS